MLDMTKMVDAVLDAVDKPLRAFHERVKALEERAPEKGEKGEPGLVGPQGEKGDTGAAGSDGKDGAAADAIALPDDLAALLESAAEALAEPMPEPPAAAPPVTAAPPQQMPRHVTGTIITRDGNLAVFYSDGSSDVLGSVIGPQGAVGSQGPPGRDGVDGAKGDEGRRGRDGVSVAATDVRHGELMVTLSDGTVRAHRIGAEKKRA